MDIFYSIIKIYKKGSLNWSRELSCFFYLYRKGTWKILFPGRFFIDIDYIYTKTGCPIIGHPWETNKGGGK
jgi:hypothetical protein